MPHLSKIKLTKNQEEELVKSFYTIVTAIHNNQETTSFLDALLSDTEKLMLAKRIAMIVMLEEGFSDQAISNALHVTRITVAKMRYFYEARGSGFKIALVKLKERQQFDSFKGFLISLMRYSVKAAGGRV